MMELDVKRHFEGIGAPLPADCLPVCIFPCSNKTQEKKKKKGERKERRKFESKKKLIFIFIFNIVGLSQAL